MSRFVWGLVLCSFWAQGQQTDWKLVKATGNIKVYHKKVGKLTDVKIETVFEAPLSVITEALLDVGAFPKWIYKVQSSKLLKSTAGQTTYYNVINMPWPTKDRDLVAVNRIRQNAKTKEVVSEDTAAPADLPETDAYVRIKDFYARWTLTPVPGGVKGVYVFHSDPAGEIPPALTNLLIDEGPVNSVKGLAAMLKDPKYQRASTHGIVN